MSVTRESNHTLNRDPFALLLIDVQKDFWNDETAAAFPHFAKNTENLLSICRRENIDVVHLRAEFKADRSDWMARYKLKGNIPCVEGSSGAKAFDYVAENDGEAVIKKQTFDGFYNPELQTWLVENKKKFVLVAGLISSVCVLLTAASAAQRGYLVSVVEDCCADAPDAHDRTMNDYPFIFDRVQSGDIPNSLQKWRCDLDKIDEL